MSREDYTSEKKRLEKQKDVDLQQEIDRNKESGRVAYAELNTDEKVLARVTDGIYRQPASAIRELISNAYDADAANVWIDTDVPRFKNIVVRDDGNGMSSAELTNLIHHIGGSAKRDKDKENLGIVNEKDPSRSPVKNRKLIGKIGIGLFSVAQLTREFFITTKKKGDNFYLEAHVVLHNYADPDSTSEIDSRGQSFSAGRVAIKSIKTENIDDHGTNIFLKNIKESARNQLRSTEIWSLEANENGVEEPSSHPRVHTPNFHIGTTQSKNQDIVARDEELPWSYDDKPEDRFNRLYDAMVSLAGKTVSPKLHEVFDNYLAMLWSIGLSVPVPYIDKHPFDLGGDDYPIIYKIVNSLKGKAEPIELSDDQSINEFVDLEIAEKNPDFNVVIDGVKIYRPIRHRRLPSTQAALRNPILFVGSYQNRFENMKPTQSGGALSFDAYIMWCPKVVPKEHNGVVLRVHNATGTLFDETFMKYQVAEHTIKSQLVAEIFIKEGLESALNIDRESFNTAHPHYQIVSRWLHSALRQVIGKYKDLKAEALEHGKVEKASQFRRELSETIEMVASSRNYDMSDIRPVYFDDDSDSWDSYKFDSDNVFKRVPKKFKRGPKKDLAKEKIRAIVSVLDLYSVLEDMSYEDQEALIADLAAVIYSRDS